MTTSATLSDEVDVVLRPSEDDVAIGGELALQHRLERVLDSRPARLVVDLSAVRFLDAPGLRVLMDARHTAAGQGTELRLEHCSEEVLRLLDAVGEVEHLGATARA